MLSIYTDGACKGNPGKGGWGYVIVQNNNPIKANWGHDENTTNNKMELMAMLASLHHLIFFEPQEIVIYTDSAYIANCFSQKWYISWQKNHWLTANKQSVKNRDLWEAILNAIKTLETLNFKINVIKVKGHADNTFNNMADKLANQGANA